MTADLILVGRVPDEGGRMRPGAVAVAGERIIAVGAEAEIRALRGPRTVLLGGSTAAVLPGFIDAHLHFLAVARRAAEVDCSTDRCPTTESILATLSEAAASRPAGSWVLAFGYDEALLPGGRGPSLAALDAALPVHPLRLLHRTGHAAMLNGAALRMLGLGSSPRVSRDPAGRPTGLVHEPGGILRGRIPRVSEDDLERLAEAASRRLLEAGITTFHDPTPVQGAAEIARLRRFVEEGCVRQRVRAYGGAASFTDFRATADGRFRLCGVKIVLTADAEADEAAEDIAAADRAGAQVAIHAVEDGALVAAVEGLRRLGRERVVRRRHRIEHASLCPPPLVAELARCGATVVTHPEFLRRHWRKYRAEVGAAERSWLYPLRSFLRLGVPVALGSDAPIAPPAPLAAIAAAARRPPEEERAGDGEEITIAEGVRLHTAGGAFAAGEEQELGRLAPGALADAVVLDADPTELSAGAVAEVRVRATIVGGRIEWSW